MYIVLRFYYALHNIVSEIVALIFVDLYCIVLYCLVLSVCSIFL